MTGELLEHGMAAQIVTDHNVTRTFDPTAEVTVFTPLLVRGGDTV
ncbi:MAG: hypothetical protein ACRD5Z_18465 [Bryobacteraceae bacterium]